MSQNHEHALIYKIPGEDTLMTLWQVPKVVRLTVKYTPEQKPPLKL